MKTAKLSDVCMPKLRRNDQGEFFGHGLKVYPKTKIDPFVGSTFDGRDSVIPRDQLHINTRATAAPMSTFLTTYSALKTPEEILVDVGGINCELIETLTELIPQE